MGAFPHLVRDTADGGRAGLGVERLDGAVVVQPDHQLQPAPSDTDRQRAQAVPDRPTANSRIPKTIATGPAGQATAPLCPHHANQKSVQFSPLLGAIPSRRHFVVKEVAELSAGTEQP
jgi:hypothetical protein